MSFGNAREGTVTVVKAANPTREVSPITFGFTSRAGDFELKGSSNPEENNNHLMDIVPGERYIITENQGPANWDLIDIHCEGNDAQVDLAGRTVSLALTASGQAATCTFTIERKPQVKIIKFEDPNINCSYDNGVYCSPSSIADGSTPAGQGQPGCFHWSRW